LRNIRTFDDRLITVAPIETNMRPEKSDTGVEMYECHDCGARATDPDLRVCETCGGDLHNIGRGRDL
jgi:rRNA maturation endonuclease Nob1